MAGEVTNDKRIWVAQHLGIAMAPPPPPGLGTARSVPTALEMRTTMGRLAPAVKAALAAHPELHDALTAAAAAFAALLKSNDLSGALHSLEDVARLLKQAAASGHVDPDAEPVDLADALADWTDAIEAVDAQIETLAQGLRQTKVPALMDIAQVGMNAITKDMKVPLMAALMEIRSGSKDALEKNGAQALLLVRGFRKHIDSDPRVAACEKNPLDIDVSIRATLRPALDGLAAALASKLKA